MTADERSRSALYAPPEEAEDVAGGAVDDDEEEEDSCDVLEFNFSVRNQDEFPTVTADELFSGGRILPSFPVFNRDMIPFRFQDPTDGAEGLQMPLGRFSIDDGNARPKAAHEEEEAAVERCESTPGSTPQSSGRCEKSASTGSTGTRRGWRLRDLVGRSHSGGNEKFSFIETGAGRPSPLSSPAETNEKVSAGDRGVQQAKGAAGGQQLREIDVATDSRTYYGSKQARDEAAIVLAVPAGGRRTIRTCEAVQLVKCFYRRVRNA